MCKQVVSGKLAMQLGRENRKNGKGGEQKQQKQKAESLSFNNMQWLRGNSCMELFPAIHSTYPLSRATRTYPLPNPVLYPYHHFFGRLIT